MADHHPFEIALVHLYRGELGRMTSWRVRLDTTTNWALGTSVAVVTFALGQPHTPHVILLLPYVLASVFAGLEARRYREMAVSRERVALLEDAFFAPMLGGPPVDGWEARLHESLHAPTPAVGFLAALGTRTRRNYIWLFVTLYASWWFKLAQTGVPFTEEAAVGSVPGGVVIGVATALLAPWLALASWRPKIH
jgi:uncharacterized membrane protein